ncbi:unnamed protein product [Tenebrio molitor]|nr:unnamed protein product [Tenebrio molitor]
MRISFDSHPLLHNPTLRMLTDGNKIFRRLQTSRRLLRIEHPHVRFNNFVKLPV